MSSGPTVALVTLGCARNDVDSEELAARLESGGFSLVTAVDDADAVLVNTCGFVESAKKDSLDVLLDVADDRRGGGRPAVVAVGCLAERYGAELAAALPEADAVLGFDDYPVIADRLRRVLAGERLDAHMPRDRRTLLPLSPAQRSATVGPSLPGHGQPSSRFGAAAPDLPADLAPAAGPRPIRRRLGSGPMAPLKLASGCDRRCTFCAIPSFRGAFVSRPPEEVVAEARWLAGNGVRELFLVSENSTSYGKDLGDLRSLEALLPQLAAVDGIDRVRVSYLQPAEMRPTLIEAIAGTPGVAAYFDLSFQHASPPVLRAMRRFGGSDSFLELLASIREAAPDAGVRSNVIVGFPGESEQDVEMLAGFLERARLDAIGVFGFSAEEGTEAAGLPGQLPGAEVQARVEAMSRLAEELTSQRAEDRVGERARLLVEEVGLEGVVGRTEAQGPDVDGTTRLVGAGSPGDATAAVGTLIPVEVVGSEGVDLVARASAPSQPG